MNKSKAIIFDLGGTLLYPDFPFLQKHLQETRGLELERDTFLFALSKASYRLDHYMQHHPTTDATRVPEYIKYLLEEMEITTGVEELVHEVILPYHRTSNLWNYVQEGTQELLARLQTKFRLALVSNSDGRAEGKVIQCGLAPYLEFVLDSHFVGVEKPDPQILWMACDRLGLPASQCYYVGDIHSVDVVGAQAAGLHPVLIDRTLTPRTDCLVIGSVFDLDQLEP